MAKGVKDYVAEADASVERLDMDAARARIDEGALVLDVRDPSEVAASGKVPGAVNVSRGMLEFRADPDSPYHDERLRKDQPVLIYCAAGGRAALAGKALQDMGFERVYNMGGFKDWTDAGGAVEREE